MGHRSKLDGEFFYKGKPITKGHRFKVKGERFKRDLRVNFFTSMVMGCQRKLKRQLSLRLKDIWTGT